MRSPARTLPALGAVAALVLTVLAVLAPPATAATVQRRVAVVLFDFADSKLRSVPDPLGDAAGWFDAVSGGRYHLVPAGAPIGPVPLGFPAACDTDRMGAAARAVLAAHAVDYDAVTMVFANGEARCPWSGLASMPGRYTWITEGLSPGGVVHEFGHNLGLTHQRLLRCRYGDLGDCTASDEGTRSPMGGAGDDTGLSAPELIHTGWLTPQEQVTVVRPGRYRLGPLYGGGPGPRALVIPLGRDRLVLENRRPAGRLDGRVRGVHAYLVPGNAFHRSALITTGRSAPITRLTDRAAGLTITVGETGDASVTVSVVL
ncbi:hypothetical protein [Actinoplanes rectilineatus]|uniref:hypothetical protein n=1 Tax=Actinoplanes rectilineatus TaxID=113571 RepID=UPI0005F2AD2E|nr:hypothetical protein [Actinoplanes rectilineatus]